MIDKGLFLATRQCTKKAFLLHRNSELKTIKLHLNSTFRKAKEVEAAARGLFEVGIDVAKMKNVDDTEYTKSLIDKGYDIIYQASFKTKLWKCKVDILIINKTTFKIYEVKSSTFCRDEHILELAFQRKIIEESFPDKKIEAYVVLLNKQYVREEKLIIEELFLIEDLTHRTRHAQPLVNRNITTAHKIITGKSTPVIDIGVQCNEPYECEFKSHCWKHVPDKSIFDISRLWEVNKFKLYNQGILNLEDIPRNANLNEKQWMQVDCHVQKRQIIDVMAIEEFISDIVYPVFYMDFETISPAIPLYSQTKPYAHIPIQYSIHCKKSVTSRVKHYEFLHCDKSDPRELFLKSLLRILGNKGTVVVYNQKFEESRLNELIPIFPIYREAILNVIRRIKDLSIPFEKRYLYHPKQNGSSSLKMVVSSWIPELFNESAMCEGISVEEEYHKIVFSRISVKGKNGIRKKLLDYCKVDTYSLVKLLELLQMIVRNEKASRKAVK